MKLAKLRSAIGVAFFLLSAFPGHSAPSLKMQFTNDLADSAPATGSPVQGGVSTKPTSLLVYTDTSIVVRNSPIDSTTNQLFETSNVVELKDTSGTYGPTIRFDGASVDSSGGSDSVRIDLDIMLDSSVPRIGNMFINLKSLSNEVVSAVAINVGSGQVSLYCYDSIGTYLGAVPVGVAPIGGNFHLQVQLDYSAGTASLIADNLLYTPGPIACTNMVTGGFSVNRRFGRLDVSMTAPATGKVLLDNVSINAVPNLPTKSISEYGAIGDGSTDDTIAIRNAFSHLGISTGGVAFESNKTYIISENISLTSRKNFFIEGNNATVRIKDGTAVDGVHRGIDLSNCENFTIQNLTVDGNRMNRSPAEVYAHNILITGCRLFRFENVHSRNAVCDGFYVATNTPSDPETYPRNGLFLNCVADNCYRQGMSIINARHVGIVGGEYSNTNGANPQAGIDIEANSGSFTPSNFDIFVRNVIFQNNNGAGVQVSGTSLPCGITIEDSFFSDCRGGGVLLGSTLSIIRNNFFEDFSQATRGIVDLGASLGNANNKIVNNWFSGISTGKPVIYVHKIAGDYNQISNNVILDYNNLPILSFNSTTSISGNLTTPLSPVGLWALDESAGSSIVDSSGNGIGGITYNAPSWVSGRYGNALSFSGSNQYGLIDNNTLLNVSDHFTVAAWIKADAASSSDSHIVIGKGNDFRFGYSGGVDFGFYSPATGWVQAPVSKGVWHHVAATFNGFRVRLYVDGNLESEAEIHPGGVTATGRVHIGSLSGTTLPFHGIIDDVHIYNVVLSEDAINGYMIR